MKTIKQNFLFILMPLIALFCFLQKDSFLSESIISHPDSQVTFSANETLSQTWEANVKKLTEVSIPYTSSTDFTSDFHLNIMDDSTSVTLVTVSLPQVSFRAGESGKLTFSFSPITLNPGTRYKFYLSADNFTSPGELSIPANVEYDGCSINNIPTDQGADFQLTSIKPSRLFWLFAAFAPLFLFSLALMLGFNRKFEQVVGLALVINIGILYLFGLFEHLETGVTALWIFSLLAYLYSLYIYNKKKISWKSLVTPGLLLFGILIIVIIFYNRNIYRASWDEYSHWGLAVKDMFYFDAFSKHIGSTVLIPRYPPFITLYQYFMEYHNGMFSESILYVAFQIFLAAFLLVGTSGLTKAKYKYFIPCISILLFVPMLFYPDIYNSIYVDPLLAILMAYVLICYYTESLSLFNFLRIAGGLLALTLTKEMGVLIAEMLVILFMLDTLWKKKKFAIKPLFPYIGLGLLVCVFFFSWQFYLAIPAVSEASALSGVASSGNSVVSEAAPVASSTSASGITINGVTELLTGNAPEWRYQCIENYLKALFSGDAFTFGSISVSVLDVCFLVLVAGYLIPKLSAFRKNSELFSLSVFGVLCSLPYLAFLLVTYLFAFSEREALLLNSYGRYAGSYVGGLVLAFCILLFNTSLKQDTEREKSSPYLITAVTLTLLLFIITPVEHLFLKNIDIETPPEYVYGTDEAEKLLRTFGDESEKIYVVCNNSNGFSYYLYRNVFSPHQVQNSSWSLYSSREDYLEYFQNYPDKSDSSPTVLSAADWEKQLSEEYSYVFLLHPNEVFSQMYGSLFEDPSTVQDGTFYRVNSDPSGHVQLSYIGKVGIKNYK